MRVGVQMSFQSYGYPASVTDGRVVAEEVRLLADELGFDALWPVEHHFEDYAFCPDNTVFLAHMAAQGSVGTRRPGHAHLRRSQALSER